MKNKIVYFLLLIGCLSAYNRSEECAKSCNRQQSSINNVKIPKEKQSDDINEALIYTPAQFILSSII